MDIRRIFSMLMTPIRPMFRHIRNSIPVLFFIFIVLLFIGIWTYSSSWRFDQVFRHSNIDKVLIPHFDFSTRLMLTLLVLFLLFVIMMITFLRRHLRLKQEKENLEEKNEIEDPVLPYIKDQEEGLNLILESLKDSIGEKNSVYKLPWYLVLGASDAGKTSFINRSNQKFNLTAIERTSKRYLREKSIYPIDWWASDEAVLIDPVGDLFMQQSNQEDPDTTIAKQLWENFISWINKVRVIRPINGIILVIDFPKLITTSQSDRQAMAAIMRARIRDLSERYGARIPVYFVLNKFDLIEGFDSFFGDFRQQDRNESLGFSFPLNTLDNKDGWIKEFEEGYDAFIESIEEEVFDRLAVTISQQERESLYSFIRELSGLKEILFQYICDIAESDRFSTTPYVRGVYFSSVFQQGIPTDIYQTAISKQFDLPHVIPTVMPETTQKTFFSHNFFRKVIYPEAGLVNDNEKVRTKNKRNLVIASFATSFIAIALLSGWINYFYKNKNSIQNVQNLLNDFTDWDEKNSTVGKTGENLLKPLNLLHQATFEFGDYKRAIPFIKDLGLYQGKKVGREVDKIYQDYLSKKFLPAIAIELIEKMLDEPKGSEEGLEILRVYRMIDDIKNRKKDITNEWMASYWQGIFPNNGKLQKQLMTHFDYAMTHVDPDLSFYEIYISSKQQEYANIPLAERVYRSVKFSAEKELSPSTNIRNKVGAGFDALYKINSTSPDTANIYEDDFSPIIENEDEFYPMAENEDDFYPIIEIEDDSAPVTETANEKKHIISALFSKWAYLDYYVPKSDNILNLAMIDAWVLGNKENIDYSKEDLIKLSKDVRELYVTDYIKTWSETINSLEIVDFSSLSHAVTVLEAATGSSKPLQNLVQTVATNVEIYPTVDGADTIAINNMLKDDNRKAALDITNEFSALIALLKSSKDKKPYMDDIIAYIYDVKEYMKAISTSPDIGKSALKAVMAELQLNKESPISKLQRISSETPRPLSKQLSSIADNSWRILLITAIKELDLRWKEDVYDFYLTQIGNRYPFDKSSSVDVSLRDFQDFFGSKGRVQQFYETYLKLFLEQNRELLFFEDTGDVIAGDFMNSLEDINEIRRVFFNASGKLNIPFTLKPLGLSGRFRKSSINIDGQIVNYSHGASRTTKLLWPNTLRNDVRSKLTVVRRDGTIRSLGTRGVWSWFRLLDRAKIIGSTQRSLDARFTIGRGTMNYRISVNEDNNPFVRNSLSNLYLPTTMLSDSVIENTQWSNDD